MMLHHLKSGLRFSRTRVGKFSAIKHILNQQNHNVNARRSFFYNSTPATTVTPASSSTTSSASSSSLDSSVTQSQTQAQNEISNQNQTNMGVTNAVSSTSNVSSGPGSVSTSESDSESNINTSTSSSTAPPQSDSDSTNNNNAQFGETPVKPQSQNQSNSSNSTTSSAQTQTVVKTGYSLPFGKHKGIPLEEVAADYRFWLIQKGAHVGKPDLENALKSLGHDTNVKSSLSNGGYNLNGGGYNKYGNNNSNGYNKFSGYNKYNNNGQSTGGYNNNRYNNNNNNYNNYNNKYKNSNPNHIEWRDETVAGNFPCQKCGTHNSVNIKVGVIYDQAKAQRQARFAEERQKNGTNHTNYNSNQNQNHNNNSNSNSISNRPDVNLAWTRLKTNPAEWKDCRANKPSPKYPDFKCMSDGSALWIESHSTPSWVKEMDWNSVFNNSN